MITKYPLLAFVFLCLFAPHAWAGDSTAVIAGRQYVVHKMEKGETLYAVSRKYNIPIQKIFDANPGVKDKYNVGDEIKVPVSSNEKTQVTVKKPIKPKPEVAANTSPKPVPTEPKTNKPVKTQPPVPIPANETKTPIYHTVAKGETIFKIAKNHKMTVAQLAKLNDLKNNNVEVGQLLIVGYDKSTATGSNMPVSNPVQKSVPKPATAIVTDNDILEKYRDEYNSNKQKIAHAKPGQVVSKEMDEQGLASWFDDGSVNIDKSLALHSTAPIGSIIKLTNLINHKVLYVKVIGRPDKTDNQNVVVKITKSAADKLGVLDKYFRVEMHYMEEVVN